MLRIKRPQAIPFFLRSHKVLEERRKILTFLRRDPVERRQRRDDLNEDLFFDASLRNSVSSVFYSKCAFCEEYIGDEGVVLHMRPVRAVEDRPNSQHDYYLWLAFEWRNLFNSCNACAKSKGDKFPLDSDPADFLATFDDVIKTEVPLLLDPTVDDPAKHFFFSVHGDIYPLTREGLETIRSFGLDRLDLISSRAERISELLHQLQSNNDLRIEELIDANAPYAGALRNVLLRVAAAWRPWRLSGSGTGQTFARNFIKVWLEATSDQRREISVAIEDASSPQSAPNLYEDLLAAPRRLIPTDTSSLRSGDIDYVRIQNFKALERLELRLPIRRSERAGTPALMILGENSTGKSSILAAIALGVIGLKEAKKLKKYLPALVHSSSKDRFDQLDQTDVSVEIGFHLKNHRAQFYYDPVHKLPEGPAISAVKVLGYGPRRFFDPKRRQHKEGAAARVQTLFDPLATIPYPGDWLRAQTGARFDAVAAALRVILALDDDDELIVEPDHLAVRANGRVTPIDSLSEGYRSVFVMTVDIIRELLDDSANLEKAQALVLIDELETHLHPRWKMQVMTSLRKVFPRVQFVVTTHDPLCLRGMDDGEVMVLQRDQDGRIQTLENLPSVKGMTAEQLLTSDYFGLASTTDPSMEIDLATLAGDVVRVSEQGNVTALPSAATSDLVAHLSIGDSPTEQLVQEALMKYLERRQATRGNVRPQLRAEAVEAVIAALTRTKG